MSKPDEPVGRDERSPVADNEVADEVSDTVVPATQDRLVAASSLASTFLKACTCG
jgi:hypothetical protein